MEMTGAKAYLVNTGWNGSGKRISIKDTRGIIDAIPVSYTHLDVYKRQHYNYRVTNLMLLKLTGQIESLVK